VDAPKVQDMPTGVRGRSEGETSPFGCAGRFAAAGAGVLRGRSRLRCAVGTMCASRRELDGYAYSVVNLFSFWLGSKFRLG
jgi:hypothetical protein